MEKLHPNAVVLFFVRYIEFGIATLALIIFLVLPPLVFSEDNWHFLGKLFILLLFIGLVYVVFAFVVAKLSWERWGYELGEDSIKIERGIIWKRYVSIPYNRIQNVEIYRGVLARILDLSDLRIETAGYSGSMISEGWLPGLGRERAQELREELIRRVKSKDY